MSEYDWIDEIVSYCIEQVEKPGEIPMPAVIPEVCFFCGYLAPDDCVCAKHEE